MLLAQDVLIDFVVTMMRNAAEESSKRGKLAVDDLIYLVRRVRNIAHSVDYICPAHAGRSCFG